MSQKCTVMAFGDGFYCRILQEGERVIINLTSHLREERSTSFSLNMVLDIFR